MTIFQITSDEPLRAEIEQLTRKLKTLRQDDGAVIAQLQNDIREAREEIEQLRATIVRAKDALIDGQSTQRVHDLLVSALHPRDESRPK